jgi:ABC-type polysaccharide/polyol phosphate transport system ATPase subunit
MHMHSTYGSPSQVLTPDQAMVEMAISSNASAAVKISPPVDESDSEGGDEQEGYSGLFRDINQAVAGCSSGMYQQLSYCILSLLTHDIYIPACASAPVVAN